MATNREEILKACVIHMCLKDDTFPNEDVNNKWMMNLFWLGALRENNYIKEAIAVCNKMLASHVVILGKVPKVHLLVKLAL